jgi:hypothetical protein
MFLVRKEGTLTTGVKPTGALPSFVRMLTENPTSSINKILEGITFYNFKKVRCINFFSDIKFS